MSAAYSIQELCSVAGGKLIAIGQVDIIETLVFDSRRVQKADTALFFAIQTLHNDGHFYLADAWKKGVRNFIISSDSNIHELHESNVVMVDDTLEAIHCITSWHRSHFNYPVIGITGSNGKTIVKEWLFQLLQEDHRIVRSPKSFNSQIGVPLSVWQMDESFDLGLFEAGISMPGEMEKLAAMIRPTLGVLTNIGEAHSEGFLDNDQKLAEKFHLFKDTPVVIARGKDMNGRKQLAGQGTTVMTWGHAATNDFVLQSEKIQDGTTAITLIHKDHPYNIVIPFTDHASIENAITCSCVMILLGYVEEQLKARIQKLHPIEMRLQLDRSINDCLVINDSYSTDLTSLRIALDFQKQQGSGLSRTVILSEFMESGRTDDTLYAEVASLFKRYGISRVIVIGEKISEGITGHLDSTVSLQSWLSTDDFIKGFRGSSFNREIILIKGARRFGFERIARLFERKLHQTVLEINLNALAHNLKEYQKLLKPGTAVMAMVKAFSYGSGGAEIASVLQFHNCNYLGVAYADEGVDLVRAGISLPVMVMNAEPSSFQAIVNDNLQPVIYSTALLHGFEHYLEENGISHYPVHVEIETGMNRLGFGVHEIEATAKHIASRNLLTVQSVFTHLAASEDPAQDDFTRLQGERFMEAISLVKKHISYPFLRHIANSAAIVRHPQLQMDMVRLGIGLYGIEIDSERLLKLETVATLRSTIAQLKKLSKGESVSYNRKGMVQRDSIIATVRIGYADGYTRHFGNGTGRMLLHGKQVPVIGTVCMDMTMVDVTDVPGVQEGDEVIIFGAGLPVQEVAELAGTIPYELMTSVSQRVKRVYFHE